MIKDLCAKLPYGVKAKCGRENGLVIKAINKLQSSSDYIAYQVNNDYSIEYVKPYLFPMSSMTEEQYKEFNKLTRSVRMDGIKGHCEDNTEPFIGCKWITDFDGDFVPVESELRDYLICIDWLNKNHFDYRNLIEKNLAIDCTNLKIYENN